MYMDTPLDQRIISALKVVVTGLEGRDAMGPEEIDGLKRELMALAGERPVVFSSEEQLKAENVIAFSFRATVEVCLELWFGKSKQTDSEILEQFGQDVTLASQGAYDHWALDPDHPRMLLALIMLLDQFRRNIFRDTPAMYDADQRCLNLVKRALRHGVIEKLRLIERVFPCLVLTHSEDLADQHLCMVEWEKVEAALSADDPLRVFREIFQRHVAVIERFGRFPHRNDLLDRRSTVEEEEFLRDGAFRFDLPLVRGPDGDFRFQDAGEPIRGEKVELAYQGPDVAMAQAEEEIRTQGFARMGRVKLRKYIVERDMPDIGSQGYRQIMAKVDQANQALEVLWPRLAWVESYVCDNKAYCVYMADSAATVRKHALLADMPIGATREVRRIIDPGMADGGE